MEIINSITDRCKDYVFPTIQPRLKKQIEEMILPQMKNIGEISEFEKQLLIDNVVQRFDDAIVKEHEPVGVNAAVVTGENLTQSSLSSHHHAGLKRGATGFERIEEITNLSKVNLMKLILKAEDGKPRPVEDVYNLANSLIGYTLQTFMDKHKKFNILTIDHKDVKYNSIYTLRSIFSTVNSRDINEMKQKPEFIPIIQNRLNELYPNNTKIPIKDFESDRLKYFPSWYTFFMKIPQKVDVGVDLQYIPVDRLRAKFIRIYIDPDFLYKTRTKLSTIANIIQSNKNHQLTVLYPPISEGIFIDIHNYGNEQSIPKLYEILGDAMETYVTGIPSIEDAFPISENLLTNIKIHQDISSPSDQANGFNTYRIISGAPNFIPPEAWEYMIKSMVPDAINTTSSWLIFKSKYQYNDIRKMVLECPLMYADVVRKREKIDENTILLEFKDELINDYPYLEYADLRPRILKTNNKKSADVQADDFLLRYMVDHHQYWYIEGSCSNISDVFIIPDVDPKYTYTLNPADCIKNIGYLAMRKILYQELRDNIKIDSSHLKVIINNMLLYEEPVAITRTAIVNDKTEWMTYATYEDVMHYVIVSAFCGSVDHCDSISSKVLTGQKITVGRGGDNLPPLVNPFITMLNKNKSFKEKKLKDSAQKLKTPRSKSIRPK